MSHSFIFIYLKTPPCSESETVLKFWFSVTLIISFLCKHQCLVQRQFRNFDSVLHSMTHPFNFFGNTNGLFRDTSKIGSQCHSHHFISLKTPLACSEKVLRLCSYILAFHHPAFLFSGRRGQMLHGRITTNLLLGWVWLYECFLIRNG